MKVFFVLTALVSAPALGQNIGLPACAETCALNAIGATGCATTDAGCICMSPSFLTSVEACISTACNALDQAATLSFAVQFCAQAGVTISVPSAMQATTQPATESSTAPTPTTLITTTDSAGEVFTITGLVLISGTSTTTVPCRTVVTTNSAGVTVTSTEIGVSVLPTELQGQNSGPSVVNASTAASPNSTPLPSIATLTAGTGRPNLLSAVMSLAGLLGVLAIALGLL